MGKGTNQVTLPRALARRIATVHAKRPRTVLDHILKHGHVTTEELQELYGYEHPPRAARDVRELGIPLETFRVRDKKGRRIAAYRLNVAAFREEREPGGRRSFPKQFKDSLLARYGPRCASCGISLEPRYLQIDHRVPYEVAGEVGRLAVSEFMLLCPSCNRSKSWTCEHCRNWQEEKSTEVCRACYWGSPSIYTHIALAQVRRVEVTWTGDEVNVLDGFRLECRASGTSIQQAIKDMIRRHASAE